MARPAQRHPLVEAVHAEPVRPGTDRDHGHLEDSMAVRVGLDHRSQPRRPTQMRPKTSQIASNGLSVDFNPVQQRALPF